MPRQLLKSHRVFGFEVGRLPDPELSGRDLVVLHVSPSPVSGLQVSPAHMLMPATITDVLLQLRADVRNALDQAVFLGASPSDLKAALFAELPDAAHEEATRAEKEK